MLARAVSRCGDVQAGRQRGETAVLVFSRREEDTKWTSAS